jgi:hypothetical protein
MSVSPGGH